MRVLIKFLFIIICTIYIQFNLLSISPKKKEKLSAVIFSIITSLLLVVIDGYISYITVPLLTFFLIVFTKLTYRCNTHISILSSIISLALSYFTFYMASLVATVGITILALVINDTNKLDMYYYELLLISHLIIGIFQLLFSSLLLKIKYFKKGSVLLLSSPHNIIGALLSTIILVSAFIFYFFKGNIYLYIVTSLLWGGIGAILFYWWYNRLKINYIMELHKKEILIRDKEIELLKSDKERLSTLVHKDNKLIPAMELTVQEFVSAYNNYDNPDDIQNRANKLLSELNEIASQRQGILQTQQFENTAHMTGVLQIDSILGYMQKKASALGISLDIMINVNLQLITEYIISKEQMATIIGDLLDNAIIATKDCVSKNILLLIGTKESHYCINVYDSGNAFEPHTLLKLGNERVTTHKNTGGSGIGLMSTISLVKKHRASFCIDEKINDNIYAKNISICFDGQKQIIYNT